MEFLCRILVVFFFSFYSGPSELFASCQAHSEFFFSFRNLSQTSARVRRNVLMCNFLVSNYFFFFQMIVLGDGVRGFIGLGKKGGLNYWRCREETSDEGFSRFNCPYRYQCKNRGFRSVSVKTNKTNKIGTFSTLFLYPSLSIVRFSLGFYGL